MGTDPRTLLRVGLTGNIGAGKSTVAARLGEHGCLILDADAIARELLAADPETIHEIRTAFGPGVFDTEGGVDRVALASRVFSDVEARRRLEAIMHPRIRAREEAGVAAWEVERGIAVTEAALLVETGGAARYHRLVVVVADDAIRLERLVARGMSRDDVAARMAAQLDQAAKASVAHHVIDNSGDLATTHEQVDSLVRELQRALAELVQDG